MGDCPLSPRDDEEGVTNNGTADGENGDLRVEVKQEYDELTVKEEYEEDTNMGEDRVTKKFIMDTDVIGPDCLEKTIAAKNQRLDIVRRHRIQQRVYRPRHNADRPEVIGKREAIIRLRAAGMTMVAISQATGFNVNTVSKWIRRSNGEGTVATRPRSGRPRLVTPEDDQRIIHAVMVRPLISAVDITQELGLLCNPETTRRHLNEFGIRCDISYKKGRLTQAQKKERLNFAKHYVSDSYDVSFWKSVIWMGEKSFLVPTKELRGGCCSTRLHGWMWSGGLGNLKHIGGFLNSEEYVQILETIILSIRATAIPAPNPIRLLLNKSTVHTNRLVRQWFAEHPDIEIIALPTKGHDINVLENVWAMMERTWDSQQERNQASIVNHTITEWENLKCLPDYCQHLVDSVPERLNTIIQAYGGLEKC